MAGYDYKTNLKDIGHEGKTGLIGGGLWKAVVVVIVIGRCVARRPIEGTGETIFRGATIYNHLFGKPESGWRREAAAFCSS